MDSGRAGVQVERLRDALGEQGLLTEDPTFLEAVVREWGASDQPLLTLNAVLRRHGVALGTRSLARLAWALLGVGRAGGLRLGEARWTRLTHLTELHDVALPSRVEALARQLAHEAHLVPDLLQPRPWLRASGEPRAENVLAAMFQTEWSGFLALLGEFGPWVYVPTVADLQALSHRYSRLVHLAAESQDAEVLAAASRLDPPGESLLVRLEVTDYRQGRKDQELSLWAGGNAGRLAGLERAFWEAAEFQARQRQAEWRASRRGPGGKS